VDAPPGIRPDVHARFLAVLARAERRAEEERRLYLQIRKSEQRGAWGEAPGTPLKIRRGPRRSVLLPESLDAVDVDVRALVDTNLMDKDWEKD
jgi:hypothetical protein